MKTAFELVNRLESPLIETKRAFDLAQAYFESLIADLRDSGGIDADRLDTAGFGFDEAKAKLNAAAAIFEDVQNSVRAAHWSADLKATGTNAN